MRSQADVWHSEGSVGLIYAKQGSYYGSGGGGAGFYKIREDVGGDLSSPPGSGKQGVVGFMWRYKS